MVTEQQEEVRVALEEFRGQSVVWGSTHRVISTADAQYRYSSLIHVPEWVIQVPVGIPADGETLGVAEQGFLKLSQGDAPEELARVYCVLQGRGIPGHTAGHGPLLSSTCVFILTYMPGVITLAGYTWKVLLLTSFT
ncbi:unknown_gene_9863 [Phodopus roborovskii]|uniref:Unknown_gene_9863 protein n=1 Tax=Phodopus roborovskii TaxID=109678 RepID=A0AAU9YZH3_PHORO|nr:unknown_gene_9863 [Phodopus roborovskii]